MVFDPRPSANFDSRPRHSQDGDLDSSAATSQTPRVAGSSSASSVPTSTSTPSLKEAVPPPRLTGPPDEQQDDDSPRPDRDPEKRLSQDGKRAVVDTGTKDASGFDYPDGGWRAWTVVLGAWTVSFTTWGLANAFGPFQSYYRTHQLSSYTESDISWIGSFQLASVLGFACLAGRAFDAGYVKYLLVAGAIIYTAGLFGLSFASSYWQIFLAQAVAPGVASGIIFTPSVSSVSHWFRKRRATALGILSTGSSIGGVAYPLILNNMFDSVGYGWTVRTVAFLTAALLVVGVIAVQSRLPPRKKGSMLDFKHFKDLEFCLFCCAACLIMLGLYTPYYYIQNYALQNGVSENVAFYSLSILNAAGLFGRIIPNYLADTWGPITVLIPHCFVSGILIFAWIGLGKSTVGVIFFCIIFGYASGAYVSMMPACIASMTKRMDEIGIRIAMAFLTVAPFALTGTPISGAIVAASDGSYVEAAVFAGIVVLVGSGVYVATWFVLRSRKGTPWV